MMFTIISAGFYVLNLSPLFFLAELATKIQSVQYDRPRTLNILRGFFYWLQVVFILLWNIFISIDDFDGNEWPLNEIA